MKFAIVALCTLALAMTVQGSVIPWGHGSVAVHAAAPWSHVHVADPWHSDWHGDWHGAWHGDDWSHGGWGHGAWGHGHAAVVVAPAHEGTYVAKTRGAVHTAPLAGHIASAASINVAPAPGTV